MNIINTDDNVSLNSISSDNSINKCSICLTSMNDNIRTLECTHTFHINCIDIWIDNKNTCPLCRAVINKQPYGIPVQNINHLITIPRMHRRENNIFIKKCKWIFLITFIFFIISTIYITYYINQTNNYINDIIINKNETELNNKNNQTHSSVLLIFLEMMFLIFYYVLNLDLLKNRTSAMNMFIVFIICIIYLGFWLMIDSFYHNTINFLKDETLGLNQNNLTYLMNGYISFNVLTTVNIFTSFICYINHCIM